MNTNEDKSPLAETAAVKVAKHASESGHWYTWRGEQILEVPSAKGDRQVKCTLAHARKMDLAPGVTTIIRCASAPGLVLWQKRETALAARLNPIQDHETENDWLARVEEAAAEKAAKAAEEGTRVHAALQRFFHEDQIEPAYERYIAGVASTLAMAAPEQKWRTEIGVAHPLGFGTKIDLVSDRYLIDFKSKDGDQSELDELTTYREHWMQLASGAQAAIEGLDPAAGRVMVNTDSIRCGIMFVSRTHPGACSLRWITGEQYVRGWSMFQALLAFWQADTGHIPFARRRA